MYIFCTILLIYQLKLGNQTDAKIILVPNQQYFKRFPSVTLIFNEGTIQNFKMNGLQLGNQSWTFKIPSGIRKSVNFNTTNAILPFQSNYFTIPNQCKPSLTYNDINYEPFYYINYFPYVDKGKLHLIYNDGQKDITFIYGDKKIYHGLIRSSKIPSNYMFSSQAIRVGNQFWIFSGSHDEPKSETLIWNIKKQVYYSGPPLYLPHAKICPIALNRTHVLILYLSNYDMCLKGWIYSFLDFNWNKMNSCLYRPQILDEYYEFDWDDYSIRGIHYFDKLEPK